MKCELLMDRDIETDMNESLMFSQSITLKSYAMKTRIFLYFFSLVLMASCNSQSQDRPETFEPDRGTPHAEEFIVKEIGSQVTEVYEITTQGNHVVRTFYMVKNSDVDGWLADTALCYRNTLLLIKSVDQGKQCAAMTKANKRCSRSVADNETFCWQHRDKPVN